MNPYALLAGILISLYIVLRFRKTGLERTCWADPVLLASFPVYYWVFALYAADMDALLGELLLALPFMLLAYLGYRQRSLLGLAALNVGCLGHAVYDAGHHQLFTNPGTPVWWTEFCGSIDVFVGLYLLILAVKAASPLEDTTRP